MIRNIVLVCMFTSGGFALADANYSLGCAMNGQTATVYVCNSGNSAEGNNRYVIVEACSADGGDCDDDYSLFYIYASPGGCDPAGTMEFDDKKAFCTARFRP